MPKLKRERGGARATARRILFTLERGGFVAGDGKLFTLTPHVPTLAGSYLRSNQVVAMLQPVLDRIASAAQEISSFALLDGDEVVFIAQGGARLLRRPIRWSTARPSRSGHVEQSVNTSCYRNKTSILFHQK